MSERAARCAAEDEAAAQEWLYEQGCTDGLPVIVPSPSRVERMALAGGLDAELSLGEIGPLGGSATVERAAICAVMAGCTPDQFPVVLAGVRALCDPRLDIGEVQSTTHNLAPLAIVNGPARWACGPMASGANALGPGNRANATIGRALRLCMINIGGGHTGISDMALLGHPGKYTFCLAEAEEESPFPPLHVGNGFDADQSTVTLVNVEAPHSVFCFVTGDARESAERLLRQLAVVLASPAANNANTSRGTVVVVLNPEHAHVLAAAGLDRRAVQERLVALAVNHARDLHAEVASTDRDPEELVSALASPDHVILVVAGAGGAYSAVMPSWGYGQHLNRAVTVEVALDQACEIPLPAG